jgi:hypothetical protein
LGLKGNKIVFHHLKMHFLLYRCSAIFSYKGKTLISSCNFSLLYPSLPLTVVTFFLISFLPLELCCGLFFILRISLPHTSNDTSAIMCMLKFVSFLVPSCYVLLFKVVYLAWYNFAMDPTANCASDFVQISGKVRRRPWEWLYKCSSRKAWAVQGCLNGRFQIHRDR